MRGSTRLFWLWLGFALVCSALMWSFPGAETIPYHLAYISCAAVYGLEPWPRTRAVWAIGCFTVVTGAISNLSTTSARLNGTVDPNSDAGQKGLAPGDVILSIDNTAVATPEAAAAAIAAARAARRGTVLLRIKRGNAPPAYVGVELNRPAAATPAPATPTRRP